MSTAARLFALTLSLSLAGSAQASPLTGDDHAAALHGIAAIHGGNGPWAVAGYRMGRRALVELGFEKHSFALKLTHRAPAEVQWACIADGAMAATGASPGKLNLVMETLAENASVETIYEDTRPGGRRLVFKPAPAFIKAFLDVPRDQLDAAGRKVMTMSDEQIFDVD